MTSDPMPLDPATTRLLDARLAAAQAELRLPSVVATLVRDGHVLWTGAAGTVDGQPPTADTQYRMGSITKTFVAVAIMQLRDADALQLDDDVLDHLGPEWHDPAPAPLQRVRIGQLLMHAAGLGAETRGPWWERTRGGDATWLAGDLAADTRPHHPGSRFHYSNVGFGILGAVLSHHHGRPWEQVVASQILDPLGMTRTTTRPEQPAAPGLAVHPWADLVMSEPEHDAGAMAPAGQLWSTMTDLARWAAFLGGDTTATDGSTVLSPTTLTEMCVPGAVNDDAGRPWTIAHGMGVQVFNLDGRRWVGHGGSMPGFLAGLQVDREHRTGIVIATNTTYGLDPAVGQELVSILEAHSPIPASPWTPEAPPADGLDLVGPWYWGPAPLTMTAKGAVLHLAPMGTRGRASSFRRNQAGQWEGLDGYYAGEILRPVRREDGSLSHLDLASFILTRTPYDPAADVPGGVDVGGWQA